MWFRSHNQSFIHPNSRRMSITMIAITMTGWGIDSPMRISSSHSSVLRENKDYHDYDHDNKEVFNMHSFNNFTHEILYFINIFHPLFQIQSQDFEATYIQILIQEESSTRSFGKILRKSSLGESSITFELPRNKKLGI